MRTRYIKLAVLVGVVLSGYSLATPFAFASNCAGITQTQLANTIISPSLDISSTSSKGWLTNYFTATTSTMYFDLCYYGSDITKQGQFLSANQSATTLTQWQNSNDSNIPLGADPFGGLNVQPTGLWQYNIYNDSFHTTLTGIMQFNWVQNAGGAATIPFDYATSTSSFISNLGLAYCNQNFSTSSGIVSDVANGFSTGICYVAGFLFVPSQNSLLQFNNLASSTKAKFPFSYVSSVAATWDSLQASSTLNSPTYQYNLYDLGIGSTTPLGNILPNVTVFSSSTVEQYFPSGLFDVLKTLAGFAIVLALIGDIFFTSRNLIKQK